MIQSAIYIPREGGPLKGGRPNRGSVPLRGGPRRPGGGGLIPGGGLPGSGGPIFGADVPMANGGGPCSGVGPGGAGIDVFELTGSSPEVLVGDGTLADGGIPV